MEKRGADEASAKKAADEWARKAQMEEAAQVCTCMHMHAWRRWRRPRRSVGARVRVVRVQATVKVTGKAQKEAYGSSPRNPGLDPHPHPRPHPLTASVSALSLPLTLPSPDPFTLTPPFSPQERAAAALANLARDSSDNRKSIVDADGIPPLLKLMNSSSSQAKENTIRTLLQLAIKSPSRQDAIAAAGGIHQLTQVVRAGIH